MKKTTKIFGLLLTLFGLALVTGCTPITDTPEVPEETTYTVTIASGITNGTVTVKENKTSKITAGETITLTVTPGDGYELENITVNNGAVSLSGEGNTRTFTMPAGNVTVSVSFKEIKHKVTFAAYTEDGLNISSSSAEFAPGESIEKIVKVNDIAYVKYSGTMGSSDMTLEPELWFQTGAPVEFYYKEALDILIDDEGFKQWKEFFKINESGKMITKEDTNKKTLLEIFNKNMLSLKK